MLTRAEPWAPQQRDTKGYPLRTLIGFHWVETLLGLMLLSGLIAGLISLWLVPIVFSLVMAVPLSALSGVNVARRAPEGLRMDSPHTIREPAIVLRAREARKVFKGQLQTGEMPAE